MQEKTAGFAPHPIARPAWQRLRAYVYIFLPPLAMSLIAGAGITVGYLLFHIVAEMFSILIAMTALIVATLSRHFTKNRYVVFVASLAGWCAVVDVLHTLVYKGMQLFPGEGGGESSPQLWILARSIQAAGLLIAPHFLQQRPVSFLRLHASFALLVGFGVFSIYQGWFPTCYVEGQGQTAFKIYAEYAIIAALATSGLRLWSHRHLMSATLLWGMGGAIFMLILSEFSFTRYLEFYGNANALGHVFRIFAYWFIYLALVETTLRKPFEVMASAANTYDAVPDPTLVVRSDGVILQANRAAAMRVGSSSEQLVGNSSHMLFHDAQLPQEHCPVCTAILTSGDRFVIQIPIRHGTRTIACNVAPLNTDGGNHPQMFVELLHDTTEYKAVQTERDQLREQLKNLQARG